MSAVTKCYYGVELLRLCMANIFNRQCQRGHVNNKYYEEIY